jgi:hypothetical protein
VALTVFDPAETCESTANVGSVADVVEEACQQKEEGKPDDHNAKPHGLHADGYNKEEQSRYGHSRVERGEGGDKS